MEHNKYILHYEKILIAVSDGPAVCSKEQGVLRSKARADARRMMTLRLCKN